jgi:hypothetical protein
MAPLPKRLKGLQGSHARAPKQEKETAVRVGGKQTPRSGAGTIKGDVRVRGVVRIENKTTEHKSFSVTTEHIAKLEAAVASGTEIPMMQIELDSGRVSFVVIPDNYLETIVDALKNSN